MSEQNDSFKQLRKKINQMLKENLSEGQQFDNYAAIEASHEDGYDALKKFFQPVFDFNFKELYTTGYSNWESKIHGDIFCSLEKGNVWTITCRTDDGYSGKQSTYDYDETGMVYCLMAALRELQNDINTTFVNNPGE